jgi:hypothetical protein
MRTQLLSGLGNRALYVTLLAFLWLFAMPASAKAQAPAYTDKTCTITSSTTGGVTTWKIKGSVTLSNLPANRNITANFKFQKKVAGAALWRDIIENDVISTTGAGGSRTYETAYEDIKIPPVQGDQYRFVAATNYDDDNNPPNSIAVPGNGESNVVTPIP